MSRRGRYQWSDEEFVKWCKMQSARLNEKGFKTSTAGITMMLHKNLIVPNNINIDDLIRPKLKIKKKRWL